MFLSTSPLQVNLTTWIHSSKLIIHQLTFNTRRSHGSTMWSWMGSDLQVDSLPTTFASTVLNMTQNIATQLLSSTQSTSRRTIGLMWQSIPMWVESLELVTSKNTLNTVASGILWSRNNFLSSLHLQLRLKTKTGVGSPTHLTWQSATLLAVSSWLEITTLQLGTMQKTLTPWRPLRTLAAVIGPLLWSSSLSVSLRKSHQSTQAAMSTWLRLATTTLGLLSAIPVSASPSLCLKLSLRNFKQSQITCGTVKTGLAISAMRRWRVKLLSERKTLATIWQSTTSESYLKHKLIVTCACPCCPWCVTPRQWTHSATS